MIKEQMIDVVMTASFVTGKPRYAASKVYRAEVEISNEADIEKFFAYISEYSKVADMSQMSQ